MDDLVYAGRMSDRIDRFMVVLKFGVKLKARMVDLGKRSVRVKCPDHPELFVHGRLAGRRNHLHMWCDVESCKYRMME